MKIISCTNNKDLSKEIANKLGQKIVDTKITRFADGEVYVEINENMRGQDVLARTASSTGHTHVSSMLVWHARSSLTRRGPTTRLNKSCKTNGRHHGCVGRDASRQLA